MTFKIAIIKWVDSTYYKLDYIDSIEEVPVVKPKILISCGLLIYDDEDCIAIAQDEVIDNEPKRMVISIPKISIIKYEIMTKKLKGF